MLPFLDIGPWHLSTYAIFVTLAIVIGGIYAFERLLKLNYRPIVIARGLVFVFLSGLVLTFLANGIINYWRLNHDGILAIPESLDIFWSLLGGGIAAWLYIRWYKASLGRVLDLGAPALPLAQAIGRLGCTAAGCCYGRITDSWLGVYMPDDLGFWVVRYPTQPLAGAANLLIFFLLLAVEKYGKRWGPSPTVQGGGDHTWPFDGFLALLYLLLFNIKRFSLAFLRQEGAAPLLGSLSWMHLNALVVGSIAAALMVWNFHLNRKEIETK